MIEYSNGIHTISNEAYHANKAISRSMLMEMKRSPYHYWYKHLSGFAVKEEPTPAMNLGSAVHTFTLEPLKFESEFFVCTQQTKPREGTAPHDAMTKEANGRIILTKSQADQASSMSLAIKLNDDASLLLSGCAVEQSIFFTHENTGLQCKARPDALSGSVVIDLKTSSDASKIAFEKSAYRYGYYLQAGMMYNALASIGKTLEEYVFVVVEKEAPFCVAIYTLKDDALEYGIQQFDDLMSNLKKCTDIYHWPSYGIQDLGLPGYAKFDELMEIE